MSLSKPNQKSGREKNPEVKEKIPEFSIVEERTHLARQVARQVEKATKSGLAKLGTEVEKNEISPKETLKAAVVQKFADNKEADVLLKKTSSLPTNAQIDEKEAKKLIAGIESRLGEQLAHFAIPSGEGETWKMA